MATKKLVIRGGLNINGTLADGTGDPVLTRDSTTKEVGTTTVDTGLSETLQNGYIFIGNTSNIATERLMTGDVSLTNLGLATINDGVIVNSKISSSAAIAYSKLNLAGSIVNADINTSAAITRTKLATGTAYRILANNSSGVMSENAAITASRIVLSDSNGQLVAANTATYPNLTELSYVKGATSSLQTQLSNKLSFSSAITPASGDIIYYTGGAWNRLAVGTNGYILTVTAGVPTWASAGLSGALPTGGTANQYLKKIDGTDYNATWDTLALSDITDVTANITQVNALATGFYDATSSVQTQLNSKLSTSLTTDNIIKGVGGVATATTDLPTGITIGSQYIYRTGGTDVTLADGGTGASLTDPGADRILFWDDSAGQTTWLTVGTGLSITGTTLDTVSTSGTYTPTLTNISNISASTAHTCQYMRVGNVVTVSGKVEVDITTTLLSTILDMTLPIASSFTTGEDCAGVGTANSTQTTTTAIFSDSVGKARFAWTDQVPTGNLTYFFTFTYIIK